MIHPGLPAEWVILVTILMLMMSFIVLARKNISTENKSSANTDSFQWLDSIALKVTNKKYLIFLKLLFAAAFLLIITAGLFGTQIPERNIATVVTWTYWWTGIIISILFIGSAWCAVCPWDSIATWLTKRKIWGRGSESTSLNLKVPRYLKKIWPAVFMFVFLTWLELGVGITVDPYATAVLSLTMIVLATISLSVFEKKAFCQYACPVGRTVGVYSQMAPIAVGPIDQDICEKCETLECYNGNESIAPCPTNLVVGKMRQNSYCTSCGACTQSCPHKNVAWRVYTLGKGVLSDINIRLDEAWFILVLLTLTIFHGLTMLPVWEETVINLSNWFSNTGQLLISFSFLLMASIIIPVVFYSLCIFLLNKILNIKITYGRLFATYSLSLLPLAFAYHISHNLSHLFREGNGIGEIISNPFGINTLPMSMSEKHERHMSLLVPESFLFFLQAGAIIFGFWLALKVIIKRTRIMGTESYSINSWQLAPIIFFAFLVNGFNLWLLMQPMSMRM